MKLVDVNSYYALVWKDVLKAKVEIKGELITRDTILPNDPRMLYGTNNNDVAKIKKIELWKEIEYDVLTTKQSVRFWKEIDEYILSRDVYIIVWEDSAILSLPSNSYRIVSPDLFEHIVQMSPKECYELSIEHDENANDNNLIAHGNNLVKNILLKLSNKSNNTVCKNDFNTQYINKEGKMTVQYLLN